jgi:hypothetical protein
VNGDFDNRTGVVEIFGYANMCSGVYVGAGVVLTAAHCMEHIGRADNVTIHFVSYSDPTVDEWRDYPVSSVITYQQWAGEGPWSEGNEDGDLAAILIDACDVPSGVKPFKVFDRTLSSPAVGEEAIIVGFGRASEGVPSSGDRRSSRMSISAVGGGLWAKQADPKQGATCDGDSGGPLILRRNGYEYVAGILATGNCVDESHYARIDTGPNVGFITKVYELALLRTVACAAQPNRTTCSSGTFESGCWLPMLILVGFVASRRRVRRRPAARRSWSALRTALPAKPPHLVALTGYGQEGDQRRAAEASFEHVLVKPVAFDELCRLIDELIAR